MSTASPTSLTQSVKHLKFFSIFFYCNWLYDFVGSDIALWKIGATRPLVAEIASFATLKFARFRFFILVFCWATVLACRCCCSSLILFGGRIFVICSFFFIFIFGLTFQRVPSETRSISMCSSYSVSDFRLGMGGLLFGWWRDIVSKIRVRAMVRCLVCACQTDNCVKT